MFIDITKLEIKENIPVPRYICKELEKRFMGENPKEEFTPEIMIYYLKHTNIVANVRDMLELIPEGKEAEFKEAVLSAVERRKVALINIPRIREIAERGGFLEDFKETHKLEKWVPHTACNHRVFIAKSVDDLLENIDLTKHDYVVCDSDDFKISADASKIFIAKSNEDLENNPDLSGYGTVICDFEGRTKFADLTKLPKKMIIKGDIDWCGEDFEQLPDISESIVYGSFFCSGCINITSLVGAPKKVGGDFSCYNCKNLTSLEGTPKKVGGDFYCSRCENLESLEGAPKKVGGCFYCRYCDNLTSLDEAPKEVGGSFDCSCCKNLTSAKGLPTQIARKIYCDDEFRPEIDKELENRKKQANQSTLPLNGFGNDGR